MLIEIILNGKKENCRGYKIMYFLRLYFIISLIGYFILGNSALANLYEKKIVSDIVMPKYFFTDKVNESCKMKKDSNEFYSNSLFTEFDLSKKSNYSWLAKLKDYSWVKDHAKRSDSLDVFFHQLTDRMEYLYATLTNSIIDGTIDIQANKAIDLMVSWAEAEIIMDTTSVQQIKDMIKSGSFSSCYQGKGKEGAKCYWHAAQEAARYAGQFNISANLVKPYMNDKERELIENYLDSMYKKYIQPWYVTSGAGDKSIDHGFYQMGHGAISVLAYAHWKNDKKLAIYAFKTAMKHINALILEGGFINNNSFRGVRGYWYHGTALNNMLAMVALAEKYNFPVNDKIYNKLTDAVNFMDRDAKKYLTWLESLPRKKSFSNGKVYLKYNNKNIYVGNASWKHKNARNYMKSSAVFLDYLSETYTKGQINRERKEYKVFNYKRKKTGLGVSDQELGFNPTCIHR